MTTQLPKQPRAALANPFMSLETPKPPKKPKPARKPKGSKR